jgi:hypothetical protein
MRSSMKRLQFAAVLRPVHRRLAQSFYRTRGMAGQCWQRKSFFGPSGGRHHVTAIHRTKLPPVRAGLVREARSCRCGMVNRAAGVVDGEGVGCCGIRLMRTITFSLLLAVVTPSWAVSDSVGCRLLSHLPLSGLIQGVNVEGSIAFVTGGDFCTYVLETSDRANPQLVGTEPTLAHTPGMDESCASAVDDACFKTVDISDPENPTQTARTYTLDSWGE